VFSAGEVDGPLRPVQEQVDYLTELLGRRPQWWVGSVSGHVTIENECTRNLMTLNSGKTNTVHHALTCSSYLIICWGVTYEYE
jgi:hypothetical protein